MIRTGDAEQDETGAIVVSKSKFGHTNIVGNEEDFRVSWVQVICVSQSR